jgi:hypothetical protein
MHGRRALRIVNRELNQPPQHIIHILLTLAGNRQRDVTTVSRRISKLLSGSGIDEVRQRAGLEGIDSGRSQTSQDFAMNRRLKPDVRSCKLCDLGKKQLERAEIESLALLLGSPERSLFRSFPSNTTAW